MVLTKIYNGYLFEVEDFTMIIWIKRVDINQLLGTLINVAGIYGEEVYYTDISGLLITLELQIAQNHPDYAKRFTKI